MGQFVFIFCPKPVQVVVHVLFMGFLLAKALTSLVTFLGFLLAKALTFLLPSCYLLVTSLVTFHIT